MALLGKKPSCHESVVRARVAKEKQEGTELLTIAKHAKHKQITTSNKYGILRIFD